MKKRIVDNDSDVSERPFYYFRIVPTKLLIHKSVLKMIHPLTRFKVSLEKSRTIHKRRFKQMRRNERMGLRWHS